MCRGAATRPSPVSATTSPSISASSRIRRSRGSSPANARAARRAASASRPAITPGSSGTARSANATRPTYARRSPRPGSTRPISGATHQGSSAPSCGRRSATPPGNSPRLVNFSLMLACAKAPTCESASPESSTGESRRTIGPSAASPWSWRAWALPSPRTLRVGGVAPQAPRVAPPVNLGNPQVRGHHVRSETDQIPVGNRPPHGREPTNGHQGMNQTGVRHD